MARHHHSPIMLYNKQIAKVPTQSDRNTRSLSIIDISLRVYTNTGLRGACEGKGQGDQSAQAPNLSWVMAATVLGHVRLSTIYSIKHALCFGLLCMKCESKVPFNCYVYIAPSFKLKITPSLRNALISFNIYPKDSINILIRRHHGHFNSCQL